MACSEEADYGGATERDQTDSEEYDAYTYESYSEESEDRKDAPYATSKRKARHGEVVDATEHNEPEDAKEAPYATSKRKARLDKAVDLDDDKYVWRADRTKRHKIDSATEPRLIVRPNQETQERYATLNRNDSSPINWRRAKEEQQTDPEETSSYTYESYSVSSEDTKKASSATSKCKAQPGKVPEREKNDEKDIKEAPCATSKHKARPGKAVETEHSQFGKCANSSRSGAPGTASAPYRVLLTPNVETQHADAASNRMDSSDSNICINIMEFWQYVVLRSYLDHADHAPGLASPRAWSTQTMLLDEEAWNHIGIPCKVFGNLIGEGAECNDIIEKLYDDPQLKLHKLWWGVMKVDKCGKLKDNNFVEWCRKVDDLCEKYRETQRKFSNQPRRPNATEHGPNTSRQKTRNVQPSNSNKAMQDCSDWYYHWLIPHMLQHETTPDQKQTERFQITESGVTSRQTSWAKAMLRKNLGDAKTVFFIFHHGIPQLLQSPYRTTLSVDADAFSKIFPEFVQWHASLLLSLVKHKERYETQVAEYKWRERKNEEAAIARDRIIKGFYNAIGKKYGEVINQKERRTLRDIVGAQGETKYGPANPPKGQPFVGARFQPI